MTRFVVTRLPGAAWNPAAPAREQAGWDVHAGFMDGLVDDGVVAYGGPAGSGRVVHAADGVDPATVRARFAADPWERAGVLCTADVATWTIWLGADERVDAAQPLHLVTYAPGPDWDPGRPRREQRGWQAHAAFMDALVDQGTIVVGGPLDERRALLVFQHPDAVALRTLLARDPWLHGTLRLERVEPWTLWLRRRLR